MITATSAVLLGLTLEQAREALERPVEGECFWLAHHCGKPTRPGQWLCDEHRAWTPNIATRDGGEPR
ncbi:MAG TPA: hypothetical protein VFC19_49510 [Candidatus Limnocylindrales bacterium]|nr:hypothetical protein [Candidatus Limnocylindrales bacterium]